MTTKRCALARCLSSLSNLVTLATLATTLAAAACATPPEVADGATVSDGGVADASMPDAAGADLLTPVKCTPASCSGCCDGNTCQPGSAAGACGLGGGSCAVCAHTSSCAPTGLCVEMLDGAYRLILESAQIDVRKGTGECWDPEPPCGLPDVYARLSSGEKTPTVPDTLAPRWTTQWTISYKDLRAGATTFELLDVDDLSEERIGQGTLKPTDDEIRAGRLVVPTAGFANTITFSIKKM